MQLLYHGTAAACLEGIKREGILPRAKSKTKGNWAHTVISNRDAVYVTTAYPWHFAACASDEKKDGLILEINRERLLPWKLCPDEDFMEQATRRQGPPDYPGFAPTDWPTKKRTEFYRKIARYNPASDSNNLADKSLNSLGTAAYYDTIPWRAVTRYVSIDWAKMHMRLRIQAVDSMVNTLNYRILKDRHAAFIRWFFGDPVDPEEMDTWGAGMELPPDMKAIRERSLAQVREALANREGLTVVDLREREHIAAPVSSTG
jgi:hypothetical protein